MRDEDGNIYDIIAGTFFLCGAPPDSEDFTSLTDEQLAHYTNRFRFIEFYIPGGTHMILPLLASDMLSIPLPNIDWAIQVDTTQGGLLLTSQLSIETNKLGL